MKTIFYFLALNIIISVNFYAENSTELGNINYSNVKIDQESSGGKNSAKGGNVTGSKIDIKQSDDVNGKSKESAGNVGHEKDKNKDEQPKSIWNDIKTQSIAAFFAIFTAVLIGWLMKKFVNKGKE